jgi:hypothetical protein
LLRGWPSGLLHLLSLLVELIENWVLHNILIMHQLFKVFDRLVLLLSPFVLCRRCLVKLLLKGFLLRVEVGLEHAVAVVLGHGNLAVVVQQADAQLVRHTFECILSIRDFLSSHFFSLIIRCNLFLC